MSSNIGHNSNRYQKSQDMLKKVLPVIPTASQTFSKSHLQYPKDYAPLFIEKGQGSRVWDIDGNEYIDMVNGLMAVSLGYNDPDVHKAVVNQLHKGITFSLPCELEYEVARRMVDIIPCAEQVRFGKTGTDATSAAIRISRAYTGRDHVLVCGYHGWQDWYIGSTARRLGVPKAVQSLTCAVPYNDVDALETELKTEKYAAFIMEPMSAMPPLPGYLERARELTAATGTVFVFDEMVTGFHFALGGAQEYFGITPDLAAFGKGMGNGMPVSAIVGRADIMKKMDDIFFSGTFGGEALSLAACAVIIDKMKSRNVIGHFWEWGQKIADAAESAVKDNGLDDVISYAGMAPWKILMVKDRGDIGAMAIKTFIQKSMIARGVLLLASHNISYAFCQKDYDQMVGAYRETYAELAQALASGQFMDKLGCSPVEPIFRVRG